jgi:GNAT superfamily N-acetyltransferase
MNAEAPTIRLATTADADVLVGLMSDFYAEADFTLSRPDATRAFATLLASPPLGAVWLAELNERAVGHVVVTVVFSMEFGGLRGMIDDLYVHRLFRNRGIGAALLAAARAGAIDRGLFALCVETGLEDHPARSLYARAGYVDSGHSLLVQPLRRPMHASASELTNEHPAADI